MLSAKSSFTTGSPATLFGLLDSAPDGKIAVAAPEANIQLTYGQLKAQIKDVAEALAGLGVSRGDRVGIALPNGIPVVVAFLAAAMAGTAAPLNSAYKEEEFKFYLADTGAKLLLLPPTGLEEARRAAEAAQVRIVIVNMDATGRVTLEGAAERRALPPPGVEDVALILHTSGSTGRPKRVPLSHANLSVSAQNVAQHYHLGPNDVSLCVMPLFHVHGLVASTLGTLASGGTVVVPGKFNPLSFWRIAEQYGVTWYSAVPTLHQLLLARHKPGSPKPGGAAKLRFIRSCSASLAPQLMSDLEAAFGAPVLEAYGMTEAAHQMASNPLPPAERKAGSVGQGSGVRISIVDPAGQHLASGQRGEVVIQGPNVITAYENNPEADATAFTEGWFRTGDEGVLDEEGYLTLVGRIKEFINRGGEKISPHEIDEVLLTHPAVAEAVCFGMAHPTWGEEVAAAVVLREEATEADLLAYCRERLADYKRPKKIRITEVIPRTATGKIQRRKMQRSLFGARREGRMKILVVGAGAIGGYIGAQLIRVGADVVLFARGPHLAAMQEHGLRVVSPKGDFHVRPKLTDDLSSVGKPDVIILGVKAHSLTVLAPLLPQLFGPETVVISTQNGVPWWYFQNLGGEWNDLRLERVDPGGVIASSIEARRVIGSLVYFSTDVAEPGVIHHTEGNRISLGEPDGSRSERVHKIAEALHAAGFRCPVTTRIRHEIWVKLLGNVAFNPISALTGGTLEELARRPAVSELVRDVMMETEAVAAKLGIDLPISIEQRIAGAEKVGAHKTSMLQDYELGRPMEIDPVVGAVIELGEKLGVVMPATRAVYACAKFIDTHRERRIVLPAAAANPVQQVAG